MYRSEDAGKNWERFSRLDNTWGPPGTIAGLPIDMQCDPDDPDRIFINNYGGGNFLSEDGGKTWVNASSGYSGAMIRHLAVASGQPGWVYASGRSGVFRSTDGGMTWMGLANPGPEFPKVSLNEIGALALHPQDPLSLLTSPGDLSNPIYSLDGGNSWSLASGYRGAPVSIVYAPSNLSIVYAATTQMACVDDVPGTVIEEMCANAESFFFASSDGGQTWEMPSEAEPPGQGITTMVVHPEQSTTIIAAAVGQSVVKTEDGGQTWQTISAGLPLTEIVSALALDPQMPQTLFAGYRELGLYKSEDGGESWRQISAGLIPEAFIKSVVVDPTNINIVYLADHFSGVYVSVNGGETWKALNEGLTHRTTNVLALSDDGTVLYVGIEGAGVYRLGDPPPVEGAEVLAFMAPSEVPAQEVETEESKLDESTQQEEAEPKSGLSLPCLRGTLPLLLFAGVALASTANKRKS